MPAATVWALLGALVLQSAAGSPPPSHRELSRSRLDERILALAFVGESRVLSLAAGSVSLWRLDDGPPHVIARAAWPSSPARVRHGGGMIVGAADERAAWIISSHADGAQLVRLDGPRLVLSDAADAAPWPDAPGGLRFRSGTNLVEGMSSSEGAFAVVALDSASRAVVRDDGALVVGGAPTDLRVGSAVATLGPGTLLASSADPPGESEALIVLHRVRGSWERHSELPLAGAVTAVAARADSRAADVVVALDTPSGGQLLRLELRPLP